MDMHILQRVLYIFRIIFDNIVLVHDFFRIRLVIKVKFPQIVRLFKLSFRDNDLEIVDTYACRGKYSEYQNERCSRNR